MVLILWWQALRGQSIVTPDGATLTALVVWLAGTAFSLLVARMESQLEQARDMA